MYVKAARFAEPAARRILASFGWSASLYGLSLNTQPRSSGPVLVRQCVFWRRLADPVSARLVIARQLTEASAALR